MQQGGKMRGEHLITKPGQYAAVYEKGNAWVSGLAVMKAMPNGLARSRYGLSVSRRVGKAVVRNRVKRLFREVMRRLTVKPGWDIVLIARPAVAAAGYAAVTESVVGLLSRARLLVEGYEEVSPGVN